jgi:SAM-dependent methyltransferase
MYTRYPFPLKGNYNNYFKSHILPTIQELSERAPITRLLDAGCGTGNIALDIARYLPNAKVVAVDLTDESLGIAKSRAKEARLTNIEFRKLNLLEFDSSLGTFDFIYCQGVIHHLTDPLKGLTNLNRYLRDDRFAYIWLYGLLGRHRILEMREALKIMGVETLSWEERLHLVTVLRRFFYDKKSGWLRRFINMLERLDTNGLRGFGRYLLDRIVGTANEGSEKAHLSDQILHPLDKFYRFDEAIALLTQGGFSFVRMLEGMSNSLEESFGTEIDFPRRQSLTKEDMYRLIELHEKPSGLGFLVQKVASR